MAQPERVSLADARGHEILPARAGPAIVQESGVSYRRSADGAIDVEGDGHRWRLLGPSGSMTLLEDNPSLPQAGIARGRVVPLGSRSLKVRIPRLELATPRENVLDARILVRRNATAGWLHIGIGGVPVAALGGAFLAGGAHPRDPVLLTSGALLVGGAVVATAAGLFYLLRPEHDLVLTSPP